MRQRATHTSAARARLARLYLFAALSLAASGCRQEKGEAAHAGAASVRAPEEVSVRRVEGAAPDPRALVEAYNARDCGGPGWRRVTLELVDGAEVTRAFTVVNLWDCEGARARTLFHLEEPTGLKNTSYLLSEDGAAAAGEQVRVHLYLPAGERRVLEVSATDFGEGLLGSDFAYADVLLRLPSAGYEFKLLGQGRLSGHAAWVVEARPSAPATRRLVAWQSARFYLAQDFPFLLGADYVDEAATVFKRQRVESLRPEGRTWTATRMVMYGAGRNASVLTLKEMRSGLHKFAPHVLTPEALTSTEENLKEVDKNSRR